MNNNIILNKYIQQISNSLLDGQPICKNIHQYRQINSLLTEQYFKEI